MALVPDARRVLLTAYADTDAAIKAINLVKIDYYLLKPWDPPEEFLFPALQDLLNDWMASYRPQMQEIRVLGYQWSARSHDVKSFLSRNQIPYRSLDIESSQEARILIEHVGLDVSQMPIVLFPDGTQLYQPSHAQVAEKVGLKTHAEKPFYDLAIVGAGPAGLAAAVYGASEGLRTVLIEREASGGQAGTSSRIENYLGFPVGLSGGDLARRAVAQASRFGVEILLPQEASEIVIRGPYRCIKLTDGTEIACHTLIIATGVSYRLLDIPGMERLSGAGVYYGAAMNEALACRGQDIYIVGGANSAGQAAIYFSKFARRVTLLVRADSLSKSMSQYLVDQISLIPNIEVRTHVNVTEVRGKEHLEMICITNAETGEEELLPAFALFIFIGAEPHTEWLSGTLARDKHGFILTGSDVSNSRQDWSLNRPPSLLESSIPGVFVAGDVRHGSIKRVASGVGEGSIAVQLVHQYLREVK
jgi:thioredoxin reductase (NADPH)